MGLLHIDLQLIAGIDALGEEGRGEAQALALVDHVAHAIDRQRQFSGRRIVRRRDRIEPRLQRLQRLDKGLGMRAHAGEFLQHRHHVERRRIAVGILALRQRPRLLALRAAGDEGDQFEQRVRRRRQRDVVDQDLAQRLAVHFGGVRGAEQRDDLVDQAEIVAGENAEGIADDIVEAATGQIELDVPGFLFRSLLVQEAARQEGCRDRIVARAAGLRHDARAAAAAAAGADDGAAGALSISS